MNLYHQLVSENHWTFLFVTMGDRMDYHHHRYEMMVLSSIFSQIKVLEQNKINRSVTNQEWKSILG